MNAISAHSFAPRRRLAVIGVAGVLLLAACGGDDDTDSPEATASPASSAAAVTAAPTTAAGAGADDGYDYGNRGATPSSTAGDAAASGATVGTGETSIGSVLVDAEGRTLYAFLPDGDANGEPTCVDDCAANWPPALVDGEPDVGDLDPALFSVVEHPEGSMLKAGDWPLYTFSGDSAAGDVNGHGTGDVWFAVAPDGSLID